MSAHEDFSRPHEVKLASNRSFGWVMVGASLVIALWPVAFGEAPRVWALLLSLLLTLVTIAFPAWLGPANRAWLRFGLLLHRVASPIVLALMFYGVVTPIGVLMRILGKDVLRLRRDRSTSTYWIARHPPGPPPATMSKQF